MRKVFFLLFLFSIFFVNIDFSNASSRGQSCTLTGSGSNPTDGSNCDEGTTCDPRILICSGSGDAACSAQYPCTVGQTCIDTAGKRIVPGSGTGTGFCKTSDGNAETNAFGDALCNMFKFVTGKVGRGVAAAAVISLGVFFFMGKVTWGSALAVALGVGAVFGAPSVVSVLTGRSFNC